MSNFINNCFIKLVFQEKNFQTFEKSENYLCLAENEEFTVSNIFQVFSFLINLMENK